MGAGRAGTDEAYAGVVRPIIDDAIDAAYPDLARRRRDGAPADDTTETEAAS